MITKFFIEIFKSSKKYRFHVDKTIYYIKG